MQEPSKLSNADALPPGVIGWSEQRRPLQVLYAGTAAAPLRVLVLAGQHSDEAGARTAVERFLATFLKTRAAAQLSLAAVPNLNPDGAARNLRVNAHGIDLNRDHLLLASAETRALHRFVRGWRPHLVVDVHTYPPRRKRLLLHNLVHCHDVFLDVPTNPSLPRPALNARARDFLQSIVAELNTRGYRSGRYLLVTASGRVRHSTPDVVDARNGLALRYGIPTMLIEGREPVRSDTLADRGRLNAGLQAALEVVMQWAERNQEALTAPPPPLETGASVAIRCQYLAADGPCTMAFQDARSGAIREAEVPGIYCPRLQITKRVRLPLAYAVPQSHEALIEVLRRHGLPNHPAAPDVSASATVERYRVARPESSKGVRGANITPFEDSGRATQGRALRGLSVDMLTERRPLEGYMLFPVTSEGGHALAVYLEPESKYGLHRYAQMQLTLGPDSPYPVLRVLSQEVRS
jgi:hypothetical protein